MDKITPEEIVRQHDVTIEEVKSYPLFAHFSDEQAGEVVDVLKKLAVIILKYHEKTEAETLKKA